MLSLLPPSTLFPYTTLFRSGQRELGPVTRRLDDVHVIDRLFAVLLRRNVGSTREDDAIEPFVDRAQPVVVIEDGDQDRKSTRLNSSHSSISYAVFCLKKKTT